MSHSPSLFFLIVTVKCAAALTIYLHQSFFTFHFHLHDFPPRLTILFSVAVISKVFSLDTAMTSCLHYNKYTYFPPSILPHFMPSLFLPSYLHSVLFPIKCREADRIPVAHSEFLLIVKESYGLSPSELQHKSTNFRNHINSHCSNMSFVKNKTKKRVWVIVLADVLSLGDSLSLNGVASCNNSENSTLSHHGRHVSWTLLNEHSG